MLKKKPQKCLTYILFISCNIYIYMFYVCQKNIQIFQEYPEFLFDNTFSFFQLDVNNSRVLWSVLNKSCKLHPIKQWLYSYLFLISQAIQATLTKHTGNCYLSKDVLL